MKNKNIQLWVWTSFFFALFSSIPLLTDSPFESVGMAFLGNLFKWALILLPLIAFLDWMRRYLAIYQVQAKKTISLRFLHWLLFLGLLLIWSFAFLIFFPGTFGADAPTQLGMVQGVVPLSTHNPILHTLVFGNLVNWTAQYLGNPYIGLALYILVCQILFTAYAITTAMDNLYQRNVPAWLLIVSTFFLAINPFVMALVCYTTKDIPFAAALLLFIVYLVELVHPTHQKRSFTSDLGCAFGWGLLMCLLRPQGIYMIVMGIFILLFQYRKDLKKKRFLIVEGLQSTIFFLVIIMNACILGLGLAEKGNSREILSVPIQQIATILKENNESSESFLQEELVNEALSYFDNYSVDMIDPFSADNAKAKFLTQKVQQDPIGFLQTYLKLLKADFSGAIRSYARQIGPYFDMRINNYNALIVLYVTEIPDKAYGIQEEPLFPHSKEDFKSIIRSSSPAERCPTWLRFFDPAWVLYLIAFLLGYAIIFKDKFLSILLIYPISYILTMFLGPVSLLRYSYVYVIEAPYLLGSWFVLKKPKK